MMKKSRYIAYGALIAALYAALSHGQNLLFPGSGSLGIQFRISEILCVLAFFTPAAVPGLTLGCLLFNLTSSGVLPLDPLVGSAATCLAALGMHRLRRVRVLGLPLPGLLLPALTNGILVGWELSVYIGGAFWLNAAWVALGEATVLLIPGSVLYGILRRRRLSRQLFS